MWFFKQAQQQAQPTKQSVQTPTREIEIKPEPAIEQPMPEQMPERAIDAVPERVIAAAPAMPEIAAIDESAEDMINRGWWKDESQ